MTRRHAALVLTLLALLLAIPALQANRLKLTAEQQAYQRPLTQMLARTFPGSEIHVLSTRPLRLVGTINAGPAQRADLEASLRLLLNPAQCLLLPGRAPWRPQPEALWAGVALLAAFPLLQALRTLGRYLKSKVRLPEGRWRRAGCFSPAILLAGILCLGWPFWTLLPGLLGLLACLPRRPQLKLPTPSGQRLREVAVILMTYPPDFRAHCLKLLKLKLSKPPAISPAEQATIMAGFSIALKRVRAMLGGNRAGLETDPALVARVLEQCYLKPPEPVELPASFATSRVRSRRKIYSCVDCDEAFSSQESLRRHQVSHISRRPSKWRLWSAAALLVLAAVTTVFSLNYRTSSRLTLPGAQPLSASEERAISEVEQLFPRADLLLIQGRDGLVLAAPPQVQDLGCFHVLPLPARQSWRWLVGTELGLCLLLLVRRPTRSKPPLTAPASPPVPAPAPPPPSQSPIDDVSLELGTSLLRLVDPAQSSQLTARSASLRQHLALELGLPLGLFRFRDNLGLGSEEYLIRLRGVEMGRGSLRINHFLAIGPLEKLASLPGEIIEDPSYGLPGKWIGPERRGDGERLGCMLFDPVSVLATHLTDLLRQQAGRLLAFDQVCALLDHERYHLLVQALAQRGVDSLAIWRVLRLLLEEQVGIRDLLTILEALAEHCDLTQDPEMLAEFARQSLAGQISAGYANDCKCLNVIVMEWAVEQMLDSPMTSEQELEWMHSLGTQIQLVDERGLKPIILCSPDQRVEVRRRLHRCYPRLAVLSWNEVAPGYTVNSVALATL